MAEAKPGALSSAAVKALKVKPVYGEAVDEDYDVDEAMRRVMDAYTARQQRNYDPTLMAIGQGLLASKGNFGEAVGMAAKNYEDTRAKLAQEEIDTSAANLQLAQSRRDQQLIRQKMLASQQLFGGGSGSNTEANPDQDVLTTFVSAGFPEADARKLLAGSGVPLTATTLTSGGLDMNRLAKYIFTNGYDDQAKAAMEMLKLQNQQYTLQGGQRMNNRTGEIEYVAPKGLPPPGERNIEIPMGSVGTLKGDVRTQMLWEFANSKSPEVAKAFADYYQKNGSVPPNIVKMFNAEQSAPIGMPAGSKPLSEQEMKSALIGLELKSASLPSPVSLRTGEQTSMAKGTSFSPSELAVLGSMARISKARSIEDLSPADFQVYKFLESNATKPVALEGTVAPEKAAAAPAAEVVPAKAAAAAVVPAAKSAAPVPAAKAAEAPAAAPAAAVVPVAPVAGMPPAPKILSVGPLPNNPSAEQVRAWEASKAMVEAQNRANQEQYKIQLEQYYKEKNRPEETEAAIQKAGGEELAKKAAAEEAMIPDSLKAAKATLYAAGRIAEQVMKSPQAFGLLEHPGYVTAILSLVDKGIKVGDTSISIDGLKDALYKADPSITQEDLNNRALAAKDLADLQLQYAKKDMKGQGAISDKERALAASLAGSTEDNYLVLYRRMKLLAERSQRDIDEANAFYKWRNDPQNKTKNYYDFQRTSADLAGINAKYDKKMDEFSKKWFKTGAATKAESSSAAAVNVPPRFTKAQQAIIDALK